MKKIVIASACRTAIGKFGGTLSNVPAAELGAIVIKEAIARAGITAEQVDHVYMGCVIQAGLGQNVARQASLKAGLPVTTPAVTVNVVLRLGPQLRQHGGADDRSGRRRHRRCGRHREHGYGPLRDDEGPLRLPHGLPDGRQQARRYHGQRRAVDAFNDYHMGITAENVADQWGLTREDLDNFAYNSQLKADKAIKDGAFKDEIVPVTIKNKKGDIIFDTDEGPRLSPPEVLAKLRPAFKKDGKVTAGNASAINDGAAALVIMSEDKAKELGITPMATWIGGALGGVDPSIMGVGPIAATRKVMEKTGLTVADMDLIEANEAFAAQSLAVAHDLEFDMDKVNVNGGAIALGHPVGASGARILVTLLYAMKHRGAKKGLATLCIGGGMGCATIVEME